MQVTELQDHEILALVVLAKHFIHLDDVVTGNEMADLVSLGEAIGMQRFQAGLDACKNYYKDIDAVAAVAHRVTNFDSKILIFCLLEELGKGDGTDPAEAKFLSDLQTFWNFHES